MAQPLARPSLDELPEKDGFRLRGLETTRLETFTDAAFAFALTLLVISLEPPTRLADLLAALREIPSFLASATLLMIFWWGHHEWSRRFGLDDGPTVVLSCVLVFTVLVYVVPLRFMFGLFFLWIDALTGLPVGSERVGIAGPGDVNTMFAIYGVGFLAMCGSLLMLNLHAWRKRGELALDAVEVHDTLADTGVWAILAFSGGASALVAALVPPTLAGMPGWVYMILPVAIPLYSRRADRRRALIARGGVTAPRAVGDGGDTLTGGVR